jgi:hypothetical protein
VIQIVKVRRERRFMETYIVSDKAPAILTDAMRRSTPTRRRLKIAATVDPHLLRAVDAWLSNHPELDRSKVIDEALHLWYARVQERAMEEQFASPSETDADEWEAWRAIRDAAAARRLGAPDDA